MINGDSMKKANLIILIVLVLPSIAFLAINKNVLVNNESDSEENNIKTSTFNSNSKGVRPILSSFMKRGTISSSISAESIQYELYSSDTGLELQLNGQNQPIIIDETSDISAIQKEIGEVVQKITIRNAPGSIIENLVLKPQKITADDEVREYEITTQITLDGSNNCTVRHNKITGSSNYLIRFEGMTNSTIYNNTLTYSAESEQAYGILINDRFDTEFNEYYPSYNNSVYNNSIANIKGTNFAYGIRVRNTDKVIVDNNTIDDVAHSSPTGNSIAISIQNTNDSVIQNNEISRFNGSSSVVIELLNTEYSTITNNTFDGFNDLSTVDLTGLFLNQSNYSNITFNRFLDVITLANFTSFDIHNSDFINLLNNTVNQVVSESKYYGIQVSESNGVNVINNTL
ncbi:MAG: right-handed parallel beta-helix repeat-containing protein, partial [Candidatus Hodarchaeales archaeon]